MRHYTGTHGNNAVFDFIASRLEMDRILEDAFAIFLVIAGIFSIMAGVAVWPVVWDLKTMDSVLGNVCSNIHIVGLSLSLLSMIITAALILWQRSAFKPLRVFFLNFGIT